VLPWIWTCIFHISVPSVEKFSPRFVGRRCVRAFNKRILHSQDILSVRPVPVYGPLLRSVSFILGQ
jgi:hypothetical protein